jgi:GntR family transcriptional regulator, histidine utilization repressor
LTQPVQHTWQSVRNTLHGMILDGTYAAGDKLPKDDDIAKSLGCARTTVQRAMRDLSDCGLILRRRKGGTHVRKDPVTRTTIDIPITRREVEQKGQVYGYQLIRQTKAETPLSVIASFGLSAPEHMLHIQALHLADQRPYIYEDRWVSLQTAPDILTVDLTRHSANEWLVRNNPYSRCDIRFYATKAAGVYADILGTDETEALLVMERTTWIGDAPITTVKAVTPPGYQVLTQS